MHLLRATNLTCEYLTEPLGLDEPRPRFGWQLQSSTRGTMQSAYRLQVFMEDDQVPLFDTGKVSSRSMLGVEYAGAPLRPRTRYRYRVRVWDTRGRDSGFSEMAHWETGLMSVDHISARWIAPEAPDDATEMQPPVRFRRAFALRGGIARARLYASALGVYSMAVNGSPASDALLAPGFTSYTSRIQYQTYDVTDLVRPGENAISAVVADGWYRGYLAFKDARCVYGQRTALLAQLHVTYQDGGEDVIFTDPAWRTDQNGPIRFADIYMGTRYDARIDDVAWRLPGFDADAWPRAAILYHTRATLVGQRDQMVRRQMVIRPSSIITTPKG
ncbi:MAG: alpha-L-rhamnosidase, partial [Clostridiales bacterium]|nr:alpha-L-rhamnosidase [Clostridiales bacterium]